MSSTEKWNPMEDDYRDSKFNKYEEGPGADLDENLQPGAVASRYGKQIERYSLCLKYVPKELTEKALRNLLSNFGKVSDIRYTQTSPFVFASFPTLNDMERSLTGLKSNPYGIVVEPSKTNTASIKDENKNIIERNSYTNDKIQSVQLNESEVDMSRRIIKGPFTLPPRPEFVQKKPFLTEEEHENSKLKEVDPHKHFLVENDMHGPERNNPRKSENLRICNNRSMHTGRSYYVDMEKSLNGLKTNPHGIIAEHAKKNSQLLQSSKDDNNKKNELSSHPNDRNSSGNHNQSEGGDMSRRVINGPFARSPRTEHANSRHNASDSDRHSSGEKDMRGPDRNHARGSGNTRGGHNRMNSGRTSNVEPKELTEKIKQLANSSDGTYNSSKFEYIKQPKGNTDMAAESKCILCGKTANKICQRCDDFYCSLDCQKADWPQHRYICFKMPTLVDAPPNASNRNANMANNRNNHNRDSIENKSQQPDQIRNKPREVNKSPNCSFENKAKPISSNEKENKNPKMMNSEDDKPKKLEEKKGNQIECAEYPPSGALVSMTAVLKPNHLYIRSLSKEDNLEYVRIVNTVNVEAENSKPLTTLPKRGDLAVAEFQKSGFFRVLVINPESEDKINVAYLDFGNIELKKLSDLKECPPEALKLKRYSLPIRLKNVPDFEPTEKVKNYLQSYVDAIGKDLKLVYESADKKGKQLEGGDLIDVSTNESLSKKIMQLKEIKPPSILDVPIKFQDIITKLLPEGENVTVVVFDNSLIETGYISCIHESDIESLDKLNTLFEDYAKSHHDAYTPRESELCLVQYEDGAWYRAECIEVVGDGNPSVLFIDFGNMATAPISKIRKYPKDLIQPCYTSQCLIAELPDVVEKKLADRLKELIPLNEKIIIDKVVPCQADEANVIYMHQITKKLKSEGLL